MGNSITLETHMTRYTVVENGCWHWEGTVSRNSGYGSFLQRNNGAAKNRMAHRASYEFHHGPIGEGMVVDHTCHNTDDNCLGGGKGRCLHRKCINPEHLEAVTQAVNVARGKGLAAKNAAKTHCPEGHEYDDDNTYVSNAGKRHCKLCQVSADQRYYASEHGGDKKRDYARERMREVRKQPGYAEYKNRKAREAYWRNKEKKRLESLSE